VLEILANGDLVIENLHDVGKKKLERVQKTVEPDLVYPLVRGRDVVRWKAEPSCFIVAPQDPVKHREGIPEAHMKRKYPKTYAYLKRFEEELSARRDRKYYPEGSPFYTMRNMAAYSLSPWKVVWREQSTEFQAAVIGYQKGRPVLPDHKLMSVPCNSQEEAHYLAALLGSAPSRLIVSSYVISTATSTHVLDHLAVPRFDQQNKLHLSLSGLSRACHLAVARDDVNELSKGTEEIDRVAAKLWGITDGELKAIQEASAGRGNSVRSANETADDDL
jgi:hypothetical protein